MSAPVYTLAQLLERQNLDAVRSRYISGLEGAGFPALREWVPKAGVEMSFVDMISGSLTDLVAADVPDIIAGGFLGLGAEPWVDLHIETSYLLERIGSTSTTFNMTLSCVPTAGPYNYEPGALRIIADSGNVYVSTTGGTLEVGGTLDVTFQAAEPGAAYADDPAESGFQLAAPADAGVTIAPAAPTFSDVVLLGASTGTVVPAEITPGAARSGKIVVRIDKAGEPGDAEYSTSFDDGAFAGRGILAATSDLADLGIRLAAIAGTGTPSFIKDDTFTFHAPGGPSFVQGSDAEITPRYATRARGRWATLSRNITRGLIRLWVSRAAPQASRISIGVDDAVPGQINVVVADGHGAADQVVINSIVEYIAPRLGDLSSINATPAGETTVTPAGTVVVTKATKADVQRAAQAAWVRYNGAIDLGGTVRQASLEQLLMDAGASDVSDISLNGGGNLQLAPGYVPLPESLIPNMTWVYG
jgi:hypothetical protein